MFPVFRVQVTPPDAEFWKFSIQKLTRSAPSRLRRGEIFLRCLISRSEICSSLQLLAQKERKKFSQCKKRTLVFHYFPKFNDFL
jgi:hypothetical protein